MATLVLRSLLLAAREADPGSELLADDEAPNEVIETIKILVLVTMDELFMPGLSELLIVGDVKLVLLGTEIAPEGSVSPVAETAVLLLPSERVREPDIGIAVENDGRSDALPVEPAFTTLLTELAVLKKLEELVTGELLLADVSPLRFNPDVDDASEDVTDASELFRLDVAEKSPSEVWVETLEAVAVAELDVSVAEDEVTVDGEVCLTAN